MTSSKFNKIAAAVFAACFTIAAALIFIGMSMSPYSSTNVAEAKDAIPEYLLSAQGTKIDNISGELAPTVSEQMNDDLISMLNDKEARAKAEDLLAAEQAERAQQATEEKKAQDQASAQAPVQTPDSTTDKAAQQTLDATRQHYATVTGASGHTEISEQVMGSISNKTPDQAPNTINFLGETIPFVDAYDASRAPEHGAGVWKGDELVDDGQMCYFVGHNPGDFHNVMNLREGSFVTVSDANGHIKTYVVHDLFTVPQRSTYNDIIDRVEGHGESVVLQTCCGDGINVRIVVAW